MSYVQVIMDGYLTRALNLSTDARLDGYPGYICSIEFDVGSIRTILYLENGILYLTEDKRFVLVQVDDEYIFTASTRRAPLTMSTLLEEGARYRLWNGLWANMKTDDPTRTGLLWPFDRWEDAWVYATSNGFNVSIRMTTSDLWIRAVDSFGGENRVDAACAWRARPSPFTLVGTPISDIWALRYPLEAIPDANQTINFGAIQRHLYIKAWEVNNSSRWLFTNDTNRIMYIQVISQDNGIYRFTYRNRTLNRGTWRIAPWPLPAVTNGVEFRGNADTTISMHIIESLGIPLSDVQKYLVGQSVWFRIDSDVNVPSPMWQPQNITANLPRSDGGEASCIAIWDGTNSSCYPRRTPYTPTIGSNQCTTLEDFSSDIHCQEWAIENRGIQVDTLIRSLCTGTTTEYNDICACYRDTSVYLNELGTLFRQPAIQEGTRTTNTLQCASRLCMGTTGTTSEQLYYREGRRCDICIQPISINIQGSTTGPINTRTVCLNADITYTWDALLEQIEAIGYRDDQLTISDNRDSILYGDTVLTSSLFRSSPIRYSREILLYILDTQ